MGDLLTPLHYGFVRRALLGGVLIGVSCGVLGVFLVLRRESMVGHGLAHVIFGGVALALLLQLQPLPTALAVALLAAWAMERFKQGGGFGGDTGIGIVSSLGMAAGVVAVSRAHHFNGSILAYLFGDILSIGRGDLWFGSLLALVTLAVVASFYHELIYATFDGESARTAGIDARRMDLVLSLLTAVAVVIGMKVVGLLLVSALVIMPAATALAVAPSFRWAMLLAGVTAALSVMGGVGVSWWADVPPSGAIVLCNGLFLLLALLARR